MLTASMGAARARSARGPGSLLATVAAFCRREPQAFAAALFVGAVALAGLLAPVIAPFDRFALAGGSLEPPGHTFLLGTDKLGRDVLTRLIWGARLSLFVSVVSVGAGVSLGGLWGIVSAYFGGPLDLLSQRAIDALGVFPAIILALAFMAILGPSVVDVIVALSIVFLPNAARTMRSVTLSIRATLYVEAAAAVGASPARTIARHVIPNCLAAWIVLISADIATAIVAEASLSYLGVGIPADEASWGGMLTAAAQEYITLAPWLALAPGVVLSLTVLAFNLLGDGIRDFLDPRLRST